MSVEPSPTAPTKPQHVRAELRFMARAFFPAFGITVLLFGLVYALIVAFGETEPGASPNRTTKGATAIARRRLARHGNGPATSFDPTGLFGPRALRYGRGCR